ncbi:MAG: hypothetical protein DSO07_09330 [Thermoproteota archaeon]|jgi:hypothetical protein|uniref:Uncharacterized protein n=1 Tax=Candidatus Methanodesulfokora washburnensis TaxID=2478471 RepID=A0A520KMG3_9CREN|nr:MAG: hypothetical protein EF810_03135 [Candidatus Methanodesulfokores washburnensis]TDA40416.1 MAG: hypothetical protein DSO07_09330 [Candidatus Korarchaeota archaeon]
MLRRPIRPPAKPTKLRAPLTLKKLLFEAVFGIIYALLTFPISLLIAEFSVWVSSVWMLTRADAFRNFNLFLWLVQLMFMIVPLYHKRYMRALFFIITSLLIYYAVFFIAAFDPLSLFGY